jgi:hypothetical protein
MRSGLCADRRAGFDRVISAKNHPAMHTLANHCLQYIDQAGIEALPRFLL